MDVATTFAERLRHAMVQRGFSQMALARMAGVSQATISHWLSGTPPRLEHIGLLSTILGVDISWLVLGDQETGARAPYVDRAVSPQEAANILGTCVSTLRELPTLPFVRSPSTRSGGRPMRKYLLSDLYAYLDAHRVDPQAMAS